MMAKFLTCEADLGFPVPNIDRLTAQRFLLLEIGMLGIP